MRAKLTYANVIATLALCLALGGGVAYGASQLAKNSVGTKQLKRNSVTAAKVKDGSLLAKDFKAGQLPAGQRGPQGAPGATSVVVRYGNEGKPKNNEYDFSYAPCLPGEAVVGGGYDFPEVDGPQNFEYAFVADRPSLALDIEDVKTWPAPADGSAATGWLVGMENETGATFFLHRLRALRPPVVPRGATSSRFIVTMVACRATADTTSCCLAPPASPAA